METMGWVRGGSDPSSHDDEDDEEDADEDSGTTEWSEEEEEDEEALAARRAQRWTRKAFEYAQRGQMEHAASAFEKAVENSSEDAPYRSSLLINLGSFLAFSGRAPEAVEPLREALALAPEDPRALHALGNALHQCDEPREALETYARALQAAPAVDFPPNAPLLNNVATILLGLGERTLATDVLERSLDIEPSAPGTLFNLAMAYYAEAIEACGARNHMGYKAKRLVELSAGCSVCLETRFASSPREAVRSAGASDMRRVVALLDRAEPHAPPGSALRERILALRGVAAGRLPGRESDARSDLEDVLAHGAEHARDAKRRANALLELAQLSSDPDDKLHILTEALTLLDDDSTNHNTRRDHDARRRRRMRTLRTMDQRGPPEPSRARPALLKRLSWQADPQTARTNILALGQPNDAALQLRALARAELAQVLLDRDDLDGGFSYLFAAADDGLGASAALYHSPQAAKLRHADPRKFDDLLNLVCRNDAFAAIQALTAAISPNPNHRNHAE